MKYLKSQPIHNSPDYYGNAAGYPQQGAMTNALGKATGQLILTSEYLEVKEVETIATLDNKLIDVNFGKLKNKYNFYTIGETPQGSPLGTRGILVRGIIKFDDNTESGFNTAVPITINSSNELIIRLTVSTDEVIIGGRVRISQL